MDDDLDWQGCTGVAAVWCPVHGDCACPDFYADGFCRDMSGDHDCPLHSRGSTHAEPIEEAAEKTTAAALERARRLVAQLEERMEGR